MSENSANPALLNADTAWNRPKYAARPSPRSGHHRIASRKAPSSSNPSVILNTTSVNRISPSRDSTLSASCKVSCSCSVRRFPSAAATSVVITM